MGLRTRNVALSTGLLAILMAPVGVAATGDVLREGKRNGTALRETKIIARVDATTDRTGGYSTRQSNLSTSGGGAIYGCRARAGGSAANPPSAPCIRANNLSNGFAFEFHSTQGEAAGAITVGGGGDAKRPFITNATGVATGLNADRVDGRDAAALSTRWFLLNEKGEIEEQSGGFKVIAAYADGDPNVYVDAGSSLEGKGLAATLGGQNALINPPDGGTAGPTGPTGPKEETAGLGGEVLIARCGTPAVDCKPQAAKSLNALVLAPRDSDGTVTSGETRKRVYVVVTE